MRVHQIISNYSMFTGGAPRIVRALHTGLRARGVESQVLGVLDQRDHELEGAHCLRLKSQYGPAALQGIFDHLSGQVRPGDIVHVHLFPPILYVSLFQRLRRFGCHFVCTEHSTSNHRRGTLLGAILDRVTYAGYEKVAAISQGTERELLEWRPELAGRTVVIPNGADLHFTQFTPREERRPLKIVSVGNLRRVKNYDTALKAVALLGDLEFEYQIAGKGDCQEELLQLRAQLGLESKVKFLGYQESVPALLASADVFLMPSRWEGFGLAAVEAMNAGLPLVVSDVPGLREVVDSDPPCALKVPPESPEAMAGALRSLLGSARQRNDYGRSAFEQARNFSSSRMVERHLAFYEDLSKISKDDVVK